MPSFGVYLPDDLAEDVRRLNLPMSAICQQAVRDEIACREDGRSPEERAMALVKSLQLALIHLAEAIGAIQQ